MKGEMLPVMFVTLQPLLQTDLRTRYDNLPEGLY
jgi:hypothetical protein